MNRGGPNIPNGNQRYNESPNLSAKRKKYLLIRLSEYLFRFKWLLLAAVLLIRLFVCI